MGLTHVDGDFFVPVSELYIYGHLNGYLVFVDWIADNADRS